MEVFKRYAEILPNYLEWPGVLILRCLVCLGLLFFSPKAEAQIFGVRVHTTSSAETPGESSLSKRPAAVAPIDHWPQPQGRITGFRPLSVPRELDTGNSSPLPPKPLAPQLASVELLPPKLERSTVHVDGGLSSCSSSAVSRDADFDSPRWEPRLVPTAAASVVSENANLMLRQEEVEEPDSPKTDAVPTVSSPLAEDSDVSPELSSTEDDEGDTDANASETNEWLLDNRLSQRLSLVDAIRNSLRSKRIINSLGSGVQVEATTTLDPAIAAQEIPTAQARFDPQFESRINSNHIDRPASSFFGAGIPVDNQRDEIEFNASLSKQWATGAVTSIGYEPSLAYLFFPGGNEGGFNPIQSSDLVVQLVQPLMQNAGRPTNLATIRIAELKQSQTAFDVDSLIQQQLQQIEQVYWELHASHVRRHAINEAIVLSKRIVEIENLRKDAGRVIYADVARASVRLEDLIQQKVDVENDIQRFSLQLAQLAGFANHATNIYVPTDVPQREPPNFNRDAVIAVALQRNPSLMKTRQEIAIRQNELQIANNQLLPELNLTSGLRSSGLDNDLGSALRDMARVEFVDVSVGLELKRPIGNRQAISRTRQAELELARAFELLTAFERQTAFGIADSLNTLQLLYAEFESAVRQLEYAESWSDLAKIRYQNPPAESGQDSLLIALQDYQAAIQAKVDALVRTAEALAAYNAQIASIEQQRGTLLARWGIGISR